jgi:hypothetical protein
MRGPTVSNGTYKAAFVIPPGTFSMLGDDGWEFEASGRLSPQLVEAIAAMFDLIKAHAYSGIVVYSGPSLKMSVVLDDSGEIEHLSLQIYAGDVEKVQADLLAITQDRADVFVPSLKSET